MILAVDPGKGKVGLALLDLEGEILARAIASREDFAAELASFLEGRPPQWIALGDGTASRPVAEALEAALPGCPQVLVDETNSTYEAGQLYFDHHPPAWPWCWLPRGLWVLPELPIDDWAAAILGRRALAQAARETP